MKNFLSNFEGPNSDFGANYLQSVFWTSTKKFEEVQYFDKKFSKKTNILGLRIFIEIQNFFFSKF